MKHIQDPVLMYHAVISPGEVCPDDRENGAQLYDVPVEFFREQMEHLAENSGVVADLKGEWRGSGRVVLTFDDGEHNNFLSAWPILKEFGLRAVFFITAYRVGHKGYMTWDELEELAAQGNTIGSHGLTHRILTGLCSDEIVHEFVESKRILEDHLRQPVDCCSIPRGFYNDQILEIARNAGYQRVFVSDPRVKDPEACIGRIAVKRDWDYKRFLLALRHKTPVSEHFFNGGKTIAKNALGADRYDELRNFLIKVIS